MKRPYSATHRVPATPTATDGSDEELVPNKRPRRDAASRAGGSIALQLDILDNDELHVPLAVASAAPASPRTQPVRDQLPTAPADPYEPKSVPSTQSFRDGPALPTSQYREDLPFTAQFYPPGYNLKQAEQRQRLFGIEHVPVLYPTQEEFDDPLSYIESISEMGRRYGAVKVVPPPGWTPPCALDPNVSNSTETFFIAAP